MVIIPSGETLCILQTLDLCYQMVDLRQDARDLELTCWPYSYGSADLLPLSPSLVARSSVEPSRRVRAVCPYQV